MSAHLLRPAVTAVSRVPGRGLSAVSAADSAVGYHPKSKNWFSKDSKYKFLLQKELSYIGAGLAAGQHEAGVEKGPQALRDGGIAAVAKSLGWGFRDVGDLDVAAALSKFQGESAVKNVRNCEQIGFANKLIHDTVSEEAKRGNFVLTVGGDHSIASATISGMKTVHDDLCVVWVDAHADSNTPSSSPSGNYHGMSAAHVMNWIQPKLPGWDWLTIEKMIADHRLAFIGLRDVDAQERAMLRQSGVAAFTMHEIDRWGIGEVVDMALHRINPHSDRPLHLSFDIDSCDPTIAPGTGTCCRGGLTFREAHYICERLAMTNNLCSMDLVEINPDLDEEIPGRMHGDCDTISTKLQTVRLGIELVGSAIGRTIL